MRVLLKECKKVFGSGQVRSIKWLSDKRIAIHQEQLHTYRRLSSSLVLQKKQAVFL
jgi:hypothetical protein